MINKIYHFLFFLFKPSFWMMNDPYCKEWDDKLIELMDKYKFTHRRKHTTMLGDNEIWTSNYPYACFRPYGVSTRASKMTIYKAKEKFEKETMASINDDIDKLKIIANCS